MTERLTFWKAVGAGNDFVVFDDWSERLSLTGAQIRDICNRRFGVGADGVMLLTPSPDADFRMNYFNADGSRGEMCGNGARCLVRFAAHLGRIGQAGQFVADDGLHAFRIHEHSIEVEIRVSGEVKAWHLPAEGAANINTGVPHLVVPVEGCRGFDLDPLGRRMHAHPDHPQGTNLNIVERTGDGLIVRTWERGVNQETLACGTGAVASALFAEKIWEMDWPVRLSFPGGVLEVDRRGNQYWLKGPAELVFEGQLSLSRFQGN